MRAEGAPSEVVDHRRYRYDGVLLGEDDGGRDPAKLVGEEEVLVPG